MKSVAAAIVLALSAAVTAHAPANAADADHRDHPGMGRSEAEPEGDPFKLPPGLEILAPIKGYHTPDPRDCGDKYEDQALGHGELVRLCLVFRNRTGRSIRVELPPGMIFVSQTRKVQNGMLAKKVAIEVPPGERFFQPLFLYCTNSERDGSDPSESYAVGPVASYPEFKAFFAFLETKDVNSQNFAIVAQAVVDLTDTGRIDDFTRDGLKNLPDL